MAASVDNPDEWTKDDALRDENARIFRALAGLRRAGLAKQLDDDDDAAAVRTWGTLCVAFTEQHEARLHAVLRPFLHLKSATRGETVSKLRVALERIGVLSTKHDDVFEVVGAVKGDGVRKIQVFYAETSGIDEYLMLS